MLFRSQEKFIPMSGQDRYLDDLGWVSRFYLTLREECDKPIVGGINGVAAVCFVLHHLF